MNIWDIDLFLWLNFDGGTTFDSFMTFCSGKISWAPLYAALIAAVYLKERSVKSVIYFILIVVLAVVLSDLVSGIFKHSGPLKHLWESFPARLRPMRTPELEGLIHVLSGGSKYGTVSAHAATTISIALIGSLTLRKWWATTILALYALAVSYSRIYLAFHFPQDILLGWGVGLSCGAVCYLLYRKLNK